MSTNRYYFSHFIEDDTLSILAVAAKDLLEHSDSIVQIYQKNNELLYGQSPKQILFLMKQNNKSIFSSNTSPSSGNSSCVAKSNQGSSTPTTRNTDVLNLPRRNLSLDTGSKASCSGTLETFTPNRHQTVKKDAAILNPTADEASYISEQFVNPVSSTCSSEASNQRPGRSSELTITASLPINEKNFTCQKEDATILNFTAGETSKVEQFASPVGATGIPKGSNRNSSGSAEIIRRTGSITLDLKYISSVLETKADGDLYASNNESSRSVEIIKRTSNLIVDEKLSKSLFAKDRIVSNTDSLNLSIKAEKFRNFDSTNKDSFSLADGVFKIPKSTTIPVKRLIMSSISETFRSKSSLAVENRLLRKNLVDLKSAAGTNSLNSGKRAEEKSESDFSNEDSVNLAKERFKIPEPIQVRNTTSDLVKKGKKVLVRDDRLIADTASLNPGEKAGKSDNPNLNDIDSFNSIEGMAKIPKPTKIGNETPSCVKRSKMCSISGTDIQEFACSAERVIMADSSAEGVEVTASPIQNDKTSINPSEAGQEISDSERKRKSPIVIRRNTTLFRSIPRVIQSAGEAEMAIEVRSDSEDNPSPTTSRISSTNSPENRSPVMSESRTKDSPKTARRCLSPSGRAISTSSSLNVSGTSSSGDKDDNVLIGYDPSDDWSIVSTATRDRSCESEFSSTDIGTEYFLMKNTLLKFYALYRIRNHVLKNIFTSLLYFQNNMMFLINYVKCVAPILYKISFPGKPYSTDKLKGAIKDAATIASKLLKKLRSWKTDIDLDVNIWYKCSEKQVQMKTQYGPLEDNEGKPLISMGTLMVYEGELRAIWKRLDDMVILGDSRRSLFSHTARDFEKLIKAFVKCLILVGILQPH